MFRCARIAKRFWLHRSAQSPGASADLTGPHREYRDHELHGLKRSEPHRSTETYFEKILSISVADVLLTRVGLFIVGKKELLNIILIKSSVGVCLSQLRRLML